MGRSRRHRKSFKRGRKRRTKVSRSYKIPRGGTRL